MRSLRAVCVARIAPAVRRRTSDRRPRVGHAVPNHLGRQDAARSVEKECMTVSSKVRIYDLAKELKLDTKRLIEEVRREGVDVSVPSNSVSKELAEKIRNKYFPKKETAVKRAVKVVKRAALPTPEAPAVDGEFEDHEPEPITPPPAFVSAEPVEVQSPATAATPFGQPAVRPPVTRLVKKLAPAARAEAPVIEEVPPPPPAPVEVAPVVEAPVVEEPMVRAPEVVAPPNGAEVRVITPPPPAPTPAPPPPPPPSRQVRVLRPTAAALNAGIRPGERAPAPPPPPPPAPAPRERERP